MNYAARLRNRTEPIRVGVVGAGSFGSQMILAIEGTPGLTTAAVADIRPEAGCQILEMAGVSDDDVERVDDEAGLADANAAGRRAVTDDGTVVAGGNIDVVVEATGDANAAARNVFTALTTGSHVVNVTIQADAVVGPLLGRVARAGGVTYSLAYGDQPGRIVEQCDRAATVGLDVVAAGRTLSDIDRGRHRTPDDERAGETRLAGHAAGTYEPASDGTKVAVESCVAANALGLRIDTPGMHGPKASLAEVPETLVPKSDGGLLEAGGVVDAVEPTDHAYSTFVVTTTANEHRRDYLSRRRNVHTAHGGKYQVFYEPHHVASESTVSVASVGLGDGPTGAPTCHAADVAGVAKRDLEPGETLDGGAGYTAYGTVERASVAAAAAHVPVELLDGAEVVREVGRDEFVTAEDVSLPDSFLVGLRRVQDELVQPV